MIWKNMNVEQAVVDLLDGYRHRLESSVRSSPERYPEWIRGKRVSLGDAIHYLIVQQEGHARRRQRSRANRATKATDQPI